MKTGTFFNALVLALVLAVLVFSTKQAFPDTPSDSTKAGSNLTTAASVEYPLYSVEPFLELVRKYSTDSGEKVDYEAWKNSPQDMAALDNQVALIAGISPVSHPKLFPAVTNAIERTNICCNSIEIAVNCPCKHMLKRKGIIHNFLLPP